MYPNLVVVVVFDIEVYESWASVAVYNLPDRNANEYGQAYDIIS